MAILALLMARALVTAKSASAGNLEGRITQIAGNTTILNEELFAGWNDTAISRGTSEILWSCIVTLAACVYTAIHLNIPIGHRTKWQRVGAKVKWALIALIAPEVVVGIALAQFRRVRRLCKQLNALNNSTATEKDKAHGPEESQPGSRIHYKLSYGFWVDMGGFAVDVSSIHDRLKRVALSGKGVYLLAREGHCLEMPDEQISDRSKANLLAKALVCAQVLWMLVQCIARKASGLPLSLLELHTMVHVACALAIYGLWWHKPLDVEEPVTIDCTEFMELVALMLTCFLESDDDAREIGGDDIEFFPALKSQDRSTFPTLPLVLTEQERILVGEAGLSHITIINVGEPQEQGGQALVSKSNSITTLHKGQSLSCGLGPRSKSIQMTIPEIRRWDQAARAIEKLEHLPPRSGHGNWKWAGTRYTGCDEGLRLGARNIGSWPWVLASDGNPLARLMFDLLIWAMEHSVLSLMGLGALALFYGGIHLTAWHFAFPTVVESLLWKIACVVIGGGSALVVGVTSLFWELRDEKRLGSWGMRGFVGVAIATIVVCRVYIVLEAFLSLRVMPVGVYATVSWVQNLPHL